MTIKGIQGFNHLPEISDYPRVGNFITDFMINETHLNFSFYKSQLQYTGISVNKVGEKNFCSFRRVGHMNQPHAFNNFFEIDTDKLDPELLTGVWYIGLRLATGSAAAVAAGSIPLSPNLLVATYFDSNGREDYSSVPYSSNMNTYVHAEVDFTNYPTSTVVTVLQDGVQIDQFTGTRERIILRFGSVGSVDVSGVRTSFLENDNPDSWWGFTDYYFDHDTDNTGNPGALSVQPVGVNVTYGEDTWTASDGITPIGDILTSSLLADGSNAEEPYVTSNPKGRSLQFTLQSAGIIEDIKHVDVNAVSSIPSVGESLFNVQARYKGTTTELVSIAPGAEWGVNNLIASGKNGMPSDLPPSELGLVTVNLNSKAGTDPIPYPFDTGIGPTDLKAGNDMLGCFGEFTIEGQTHSTFSSSVGMSYGTFVDQQAPLTVVKCIYNGTILLIPITHIKRSVSWDNIYNRGLVYGDGQTGHPAAAYSTLQDKTVVYEGYTYKVRLIKGWDNPDIELSSAVYYYPNGGSLDNPYPPGIGGEFRSLFPRLAGVPNTDDWSSLVTAPYMFGMNGNQWLMEGFIHPIGERYARLGSPATRGGLQTTQGRAAGTTAYASSYYWRPVLELVQE